MTKHFCDVCGKELSALEQVNAYNIKIVAFINDLQNSSNEGEING